MSELTEAVLRLWDLDAVRTLGYNQAGQGFGRDDYPIDFAPDEIEAWQRGWDYYHEAN